MKRTFFNIVLVAVCVTVLAGCSASRQTSHWFKKGPWYNGLNLVPYSGMDRKEFEDQYRKNKHGWDLALKYLKETDLDKVAPGKYVLDGDNVYVSVTEGPDKEFDKTNWESHRRVIDVQYIAKGKERMGVVPVSAATVTRPYDEKRDVANYSAGGKFYTAEPGTLYIFFPNDAHRPSIRVEGHDIVKKVVVKVRYAG